MTRQVAERPEPQTRAFPGNEMPAANISTISDGATTGAARDDLSTVMAGIRAACERRALAEAAGPEALAAFDSQTQAEEIAAKKRWLCSSAQPTATPVKMNPMPTPSAPAVMPANLADPWAAVSVQVDLSRDPPPMPWLVPGLEIGPGRPTALLGYANTAKTPLALAIAIAVASGRPVLDMPVVPGRVAWLSYEAARVSHGKARRIARGLGVDLAQVPLDMRRMTRLLTEPGVVTAIHAIIHQQRYSLCVLDTYASAIGAVDHNAAEFALALRQLEQISDLTGCAFLVLIHSKKDQRGDLSDLAGHNSAAGAVQVVIGLSRPEDGDKDKSLIDVRCVRELERGFAPFQIRFVDDDAADALRLVRVPDASRAAPVDSIAVAEEKILAWLREHRPDGGHVRWASLETELRHRATELRAARERLRHAGQIDVSESPLTVGLRLNPPAYDPKVFAPPPVNGEPVQTAADSYDSVGQAVRSASALLGK